MMEHDFKRTNSGALINTNIRALEQRRKAKAQQVRVKELETKVDNLSDSLSRIEKLLLELGKK
jgi:hypothetical protein